MGHRSQPKVQLYLWKPSINAGVLRRSQSLAERPHRAQKSLELKPTAPRCAVSLYVDRRKVELKNPFYHGEYEIVIQKSARTSALRLVPDRGEPRAPAAVGMLRRVVPNPVHAP